jgi:hypothetical protein
MASKYMRTFARIQIPDTDCTVRRSADKGILARRESPNTSFVTFELQELLTSRRRINLDGMVVRSRDDAAVREDEACDD